MKNIFSEQESAIERKEEVFFEGTFQPWQSAGGLLNNNYGRYQVRDFTSDNLVDLYYSESILSDAFGIIDLSLGGDQTNFSDVDGSVYKVRFKNRSVQWNYYLVDEEISFESIDVFKEKSKILFSEPVEVTLVNGKRALKMQSKSLVPLQKSYNGSQIHAQTKIRPVDNNPARKRKIDLPTPNIQRIKGIIEDNVETYYADMYVQL